MDSIQAGRMLNLSVSLDLCADRLKRNILDFMTTINNAGVLALDFDGCLTEFKYNDKSLLPCRNSEIDIFYQNGGSLYKDAKPSMAMKYIVSQCELEGIPIFIVTKTFKEAVKDKNNFIRKNFCEVPSKNVLHCLTGIMDESSVDPENKDKNLWNKSDCLLYIHNLYPNKKIVFAEDTADNILAVEENELLNKFIIGYHISSLLK